MYTVDATGPACRTTDATLLGLAVSDMEAAYTAAAGVPAGVGPFLNVGAGDVSGQTLVPGTYTWGSNVTIPTDLMLDAQGDANAVWIFQITGTLDLAAGKQVLLSGGAQASNVFWQVADTVTIGAGAHFEGTILAQTNIAMITGATLNGRMLAQTAVTLQSNVVSMGAASAVTVSSVILEPTPSVSGGGVHGGNGPIIHASSQNGEGANSQPIVTNASLSGSTGDGQVLGASATRKFTRNLRHGSRGDDVKELQSRLLAAGVYNYAVTGYFGPITKKAVQSFQSQNKLPSFGFCGPMTRALLNK